MKPNLDELDLEYWRNKLFFKTILIFLPLSIIAYIPAFILCVKTQLWSLLIMDTLAYIALLYFILKPKLNIRIKKILFICILYLLAAGLLAFMGNYGPGMLYLLAVSVFSTLILGKKAGSFTLLLNGILYIAIIFLSSDGWFNYVFFGDYTPVTWAAVGVNLLFLNVGLFYGVNELLDGLTININKQKQLDLQLKMDKNKLESALNKAEESDRLKTAFLANMSHEIRTPMNGIYGFASLLKSNLTRKKQERYIEIIQNSSEILLTIIDDVIEQAKLDASIISLHLSGFNISGLVEQLYSTFRMKSKTNLKFILKNRVSETHDSVFGDRAKISQILSNMLSNAFKYTTEGSIIFTVDYEAAKNYYRFSVIDTGIGIEPEIQGKIYTRFYQETEKSPGVGLGLSISRSLTDLMNGEISLESEPGKGSTFVLKLPLKHADN
ncbi:MAG: sensor histidine kinase [Bacteroidota bacterium]